MALLVILMVTATCIGGCFDGHGLLDGHGRIHRWIKRKLSVLNLSDCIKLAFGLDGDDEP